MRSIISGKLLIIYYNPYLSLDQKKFEDCGTISLMSTITKMLFRIIKRRVRNKIKQERKRTNKNHTHSHGVIRRSCRSKNTYVPMSHRLHKSVYCVKLEEIIQLPDQLSIYGRHLQIIKTLYWPKKKPRQ